MVKTLPAMQEIWVQPLVGENKTNNCMSVTKIILFGPENLKDWESLTKNPGDMSNIFLGYGQHSAGKT